MISLNKSNIFFVLSLNFMAGVFTRSFWNFDLVLILIVFVLAIIILTLNYKNKYIWLAALAILFFGGGVWRTDFELNKIDNLNLENLEGKNFSGMAVIVKEPELKEKYQQVIVKINVQNIEVIKGVQTDERKKIKDKKSKDTEKVLINANLYEKLEYGDVLKINCDLKIPENFSENFDYQMFLAKDKIYYLCQHAKIEKIAKGKGNRFYGGLLRMKNKLEENVNRVIPQPQAALGNGLLFGGDERLSKNIQEKFSRIGMTHILAVSGYNVTIIANYLILLGVFLGLWRPQAFWFAVAGIILFVVMIGFPSSTRAGIMGTTLIWAMKNGRLGNSQNAILLAGAVMLFFNPLLLRWDIGFQLSFLAAAGIIILNPFWEKFLINKVNFLRLGEIIFMTFSAQIFVLPIILYNFKTLSISSLPANLLILPIIPLTMFLVFLTAVFGLIFSPLSFVFGWLAYFPLKYEIEIVKFLSNWKWTNAEINFTWFWMIAWYAILFAMVILFKKENIKILNTDLNFRKINEK